MNSALLHQRSLSVSGRTVSLLISRNNASMSIRSFCTYNVSQWRNANQLSKRKASSSIERSGVEPHVIFEQINDFGVITLNRPEVINTISVAMFDTMLPVLRVCSNRITSQIFLHITIVIHLVLLYSLLAPLDSTLLAPISPLVSFGLALC